MASDPPKARPATRTRGSAVYVAIGTLTLVLLAILWTAIVLHVADERAEDLADLQRRNTNAVAVVEEQTLRTLKSTNQALSLVKHEFERLGTPPSVRALVESGDLDDTLFDRIEIADEQGRVSDPDGPVRSVADLDFFQRLRERRSDDLYISRPAFESASKRWVITLARRAQNPDGSFGGIVFAAVNVAYFTRLYQRDDLGEKGFMTLVGRADGIVRATRIGERSFVGQDERASRLLAQQALRPAGSFAADDPYENVHRLYSYATLREYPFIVAVGISTDEMLAASREHARDYYVSAALMTLVTLIVAGGAIVTIALKRRAFSTLARSEARYREIFTHTQDGIVVLERDGEGGCRVVDANEAFAAMSGYSASALQGRKIDEAMPAAAPAIVRQVERTAMRPGPRSFVRSLDFPAGRRNLHVTLVPIHDEDGRVPRVMAVIRDRTESEQAATALQFAHASSRAKTEFLATMGQELREPITGVLGMFQLLAGTPLDRDQMMMLELMQNSGRSLLRVVEEVVDLSHMESGTLRLDAQPTSLPRLVESTVSVHHAAAQARGARLEARCDACISPALLVDSVRLRQVLSNLVANALDASSHGQVRLAVDLVDRTEDSELVRFAVSDTGSPLSKAERDSLFEPLAAARADVPSARAALALAICQRLVSLMGGTLEVESGTAGGRCVSFTLRLALCDAAAATAQVHAFERPGRKVP